MYFPRTDKQEILTHMPLDTAYCELKKGGGWELQSDLHF